jgi:hypothetical protein
MKYVDTNLFAVCHGPLKVGWPQLARFQVKRKRLRKKSKGSFPVVLGVTLGHTAMPATIAMALTWFVSVLSGLTSNGLGWGWCLFGIAPAVLPSF